MSLRYACEEEDERKTRKEPVEQQAEGQRGNWLGNMVGQPKARRRCTGLTAGACCLGQDQVEAAGIDKWGKLGQSKSVGWVEARLWEVMEASLWTSWTVACQAPLSMGFFPGKNTGVGCHFLLQGIFPTQGWNPRLLFGRQILYR